MVINCARLGERIALNAEGAYCQVVAMTDKCLAETNEGGEGTGYLDIDWVVFIMKV